MTCARTCIHLAAVLLLVTAFAACQANESYPNAEPSSDAEPETMAMSFFNAFDLPLTIARRKLMTAWIH